MNLAPAHQPAWRFIGRRRKSGVNLRDLGSSAATGILHGKRYLRQARLQSGIRESCIGQTEAEREQRLLLFRVEPFVADLQSFGVKNIEGRQRRTEWATTSA